MKSLPETAKKFESAYIVNVTPELAAQWLRRNHFNRNLVASRCHRYCNEMELNLWRLTHQGIAFNKDGMLIDGQHRLMAVCMSKKTVPMLVVTNAEYRQHEVIDAGKPRTNLDVLQLEANNQRINFSIVSTLESLVAGRHCRKLNLGSIVMDRYYKGYKASVHFAVDNFRDLKASRRLNDPTLRGVIARAWHSVPSDRLIMFTAMYRSVYDRTPLICGFRDWMLSLSDRRESTRREIYKRSELTLQAYLNGKDEIQIPDPFVELFPIPSSKT